MQQQASGDKKLRAHSTKNEAKTKTAKKNFLFARRLSRKLFISLLVGLYSNKGERTREIEYSINLNSCVFTYTNFRWIYQLTKCYISSMLQAWVVFWCKYASYYLKITHLQSWQSTRGSTSTAFISLLALGFTTKHALHICPFEATVGKIPLTLFEKCDVPIRVPCNSRWFPQFNIAFLSRTQSTKSMKKFALKPNPYHVDYVPPLDCWSMLDCWSTFRP